MRAAIFCKPQKLDKQQLLNWLLEEAMLLDGECHIPSSSLYVHAHSYANYLPPK